MRQQHRRANLGTVSVRGLFARPGARPQSPPFKSLSGDARMIRQTAAAVVALGLSATVAFAQPPAAQTNPSAPARAARVSPDEPPNNTGPVVERRTTRGAEAGERKIGD